MPMRLFSIAGFSRRGVLAALAAALVLVAPPARADDLAVGAQKFVETLADDAIGALTQPDVPRDERINRFRTLFNDRFAVRAIGRHILGRHWRDTTPAQQEEYFTLFEDLMVVSYVDRFARYTGDKLTIVRTRADSDQYATVFSQFKADTGAKPVAVDWRIGKAKDRYFVMDVVVAGASMSGSLKSQFASIIKSSGNGIDGLLTELRQNTESMRAQ